MRGHFQVALHGDVRGAGRFAGGRAGVVAIDAVVVAVIDIPFFRAPLHGVGQLLPGIFHRAVLGAQLLPQLDGARGAVFHTAAAGNAVFGFHLRHIGRTAHIGRIEQLAGAQGVADVDVAVADGKNFVLAVNVGDLVHKTVVLGAPQDLQHLVVSNIMALFGLHQIIGHIAHADAPVLRVVGAALAHAGAGHAAGARAGRVFAFVFFQPVGNVLDIGGPVLCFNGFFHGDDVHPDARAARRNHGGDVLQGQEGHALKKSRHLGIVLDLLLVHIEKFRAAGYEHRQNVLLFMPFVFPVVLQQAHATHLVQQRFQLFGGLARGFYKLGQRHGLAHLHLQGDIRHFIRHHARQAPVFRVFRRQAVQLGGNAVCDHTPQF